MRPGGEASVGRAHNENTPHNPRKGIGEGGGYCLTRGSQSYLIANEPRRRVDDVQHLGLPRFSHRRLVRRPNVPFRGGWRFLRCRILKGWVCRGGAQTSREAAVLFSAFHPQTRAPNARKTNHHRCVTGPEGLTGWDTCAFLASPSPRAACDSAQYTRANREESRLGEALCRR